MFFCVNVFFLLAFERQRVKMSAPPRWHEAAGVGVQKMKKYPHAKTVVTVLVIVWYVLEIILKLEQLLC